RGQRRLAAAGGADLQPADGTEAAGAAAGAADGAAQAAALSDFSHAGKTGPPRAPHAAAAGSQLEPVFQLAVRTALVTFARALLKPGVETIFASFHPTTETPRVPAASKTARASPPDHFQPPGLSLRQRANDADERILAQGDQSTCDSRESGIPGGTRHRRDPGANLRRYDGLVRESGAM